MRHRHFASKIPLVSYMLVWTLTALPAKAQANAQVSNLLANGTFLSSSTNKIPNWQNINRLLPAACKSENGSQYVSLNSPAATSSTGISQTVPIVNLWKKMLLRGSIRVNIGQDPSTLGSKAYIGVMIKFQDKSGNLITQTQSQSWLSPTISWVDINQMLDVPAGAALIVVAPQIVDAQATADFKSFNLCAFVPTFIENFQGDSLDPNRWNITTGKHNVLADELEWFSPDNVKVSGNVLDIHAKQENSNGYPYQSGQISTIGKFQQLYGIFEFELKLPVTEGAWPAAYLLRYDDCWPPEIDVEELSGNDTGEVLETNHYADDFGRSCQSSVNFSSEGIDRTQWHKYAVVWEPGQLAWYVDGVYEGTTGEPYDHVSDDPMYITLNLAIGSYGGDPSQSIWPQDFYCRSVRVYQRTDLPIPLYPQASEEITLPNRTVSLSALGCIPAETASVDWKLLEGPAPAKIDNSHALTTTAIVSKPGMYQFRITETDGTDRVSSDLLVYVNSALGTT